MKTKILSIVLVLMFVFSCVAYADMSFETPVFDYGTLKLELSGNTTNDYVEGVTISVVPYGADRSILSAEDVGNGMLYDYVLSADDGSFAYAVTLNENFKSGKYKVYADTATQTAVSSFIFLNGNDAQPVIDELNRTSGAVAVRDLIGGNTDALGIDKAEFLKYDSYISNVINASKPDGGYDIDTFLKQYHRAYTLAMLKNGATTMDVIVSDYGTLVGIDANLYNSLTSEAKVHLEALIRAETGYNGDIMRYDYNYVLAQIKASAGYEEQGAIILANADVIGINTTKYESINNAFYKDKVLKNIYGTYNKLEDIVPVWNRVVDDCYSEWKGDKGTSGGSGGGGGGGAGGGSIGNDGGFTVTGPVGNEDIFTEEGKPAVNEDKSDTFSDTKGHWAEGSIYNLYLKGIVNGYEDGTFKPNNTVTRAEFVKMLTSAVNLSTTDVSDVSFDDVSDADWYAKPVKLAAANGLVQGYDGKFRPTEKILRQDAAIVIYNALAGAGYKLEGEKTFNDDADISDYAKKYVLALASKGIINGSDGKFLPKNTLTRAEAVKLIENLLNYSK